MSDVTLGSFWVRFRASSVFHCHGVLVWRRAVFSIGFSTTGKGWEKATFYRVSEGTLESFLVRFRGLSVLHCHSVLVSGFSVLHCHGVLVCFQHRIQYNGKRLGKGGYFLISWLVRLSLQWCFGVAEGCFQHRSQYNGKRLGKGKKVFFIGFQKGR